jgi:hypothetical protein
MKFLSITKEIMKKYVLKIRQYKSGKEWEALYGKMTRALDYWVYVVFLTACYITDFRIIETGVA